MSWKLDLSSLNRDNWYTREHGSLPQNGRDAPIRVKFFCAVIAVRLKVEVAEEHDGAYPRAQY